MLEVFPNSAPDGVNKGFGLTQVSAKEGLKFLSGDGDVSFMLYFPLVFLSAKQGGILEKSGGKWPPILTFGPGSGKMIFTLLEEVIVL